MEITSIQKNIHTSPRKLRLVADMVRRLTPLKALQTLGFTNKAAAGPLSKAIKTALANAKQQNLEESTLVFAKLEINEGLKLPRYRAGTRGRAKPYNKKWSHIKVVLTDEVVTKQEKKEKEEMDSKVSRSVQN